MSLVTSSRFQTVNFSLYPYMAEGGKRALRGLFYKGTFNKNSYIRALFLWPNYFSPGISLEGMMLKLKFQSYGHLMQRADSLEKTLTLGKIEGRKKRG